MTPEQTARLETLTQRTRATVEDLEFIEYCHVMMNYGKEYHTININIYGKGRTPRSADSVEEMLDMWDRYLSEVKPNS